MKTRFKGIFALLMACLLLLALTPEALAAGSGVRFENGRVIAFRPGSLYTDTDLFGGFKGVMPGDVRTERIEVENRATDCDYIKVYLRALPHGADNPLSEAVAQTETVESMRDFLSQLSMTVWNGTTKIFEASPDQTDGLAENVYLGTLQRNESLSLDVELRVPVEMGNEYQNRAGEVDWVFVVEGFTGETPPIVPGIVTTSVTVQKQWVDNGQRRPESVSAALYNGTTLYETVLLGEWNNWTYTWRNLDGNGNWNVVEASVPRGYAVSYQVNGSVVTIRNARISGPLIQTGLINWPVPVLGAIGLALVVYGAVLLSRKSKKKDA